MKFVKIAMASIAAAGLLATPIAVSAATANPAAKLSVAQSVKANRAVTATSKKSKLEGGSTIIALIAAAAVVGGIALAAGGDSSPNSP
jgi:hypothetical protein